MMIQNRYARRSTGTMPRPENISHILSRRTDKIIKARNRRFYYGACAVASMAVFGLSFMNFTENLDRIISYWMSSSPYDGTIDAATRNWDYWMFIISAVCLLVFGVSLALWKKYHKKYKDQEKAILEIIDAKCCNCHSSCTCKDDYIRYMEKEEFIDLL